MSEDKFNNDFKSDTLAEDQILLEKILSPLDLRRDLLIEHLNKIKEYYGILSEKNIGKINMSVLHEIWARSGFA